jgi:hypothetical protein
MSTNNKIFIITFRGVTVCSLPALDTIKTNKIAIDDTRYILHITICGLSK